MIDDCTGFIARYIDKSHTPCQRRGIQETALSCRAHFLVTVCGIHVGSVYGAGVLDTEIRRRHCRPVTVNDNQITLLICYILNITLSVHSLVIAQCLHNIRKDDSDGD